VHFLHVRIKQSGQVFGVLRKRVTEEGEVYDLCDERGHFLKTVPATDVEPVLHSSKELK
jgi:hypothetical protein